MKNNRKNGKRKAARRVVAAATDGQVDEEREAKAEDLRSKKGIKGPNPDEGRCADCGKVRRLYPFGIEIKRLTAASSIPTDSPVYLSDDGGTPKRQCAKCLRRDMARRHKQEQARVEKVARQLGVISS